MICSVGITDLIQLANEGLIAFAGLLGLSTGIVAWWFILKD